MMTEGRVKNPSVFTVDTYRMEPPPLPPRPGRRRQTGLTQVLLFLLVTVALSGMVVEAWLIYRLYHPLPANTTVPMPSAAKLIGNAPNPGHAFTKCPRLEEDPSKPLAHLTDGQDVTHGKHILSWSTVSDPLLCKVSYEDGRLVFQENGYYYIYSKISFRSDDHHSFHHSIELKTTRYLGKKDIKLLMSRHSLKSNQSNSFLAGVFYFYRNDYIFVKVSDGSQVVHYDPSENVFGVFMI